jgi:hypothetical protein
MLAAVFAVLFCSLAFKPIDININKNIRDSALAVKNVRDARAVVLGDTCLIALKTGPIYFKREQYEIGDLITNNVLLEFEGITNVIVSYDLDVFIKTSAVYDKALSGKSQLELKDDILYLFNLTSLRKLKTLA